jgi:hypothetical protein
VIKSRVKPFLCLCVLAQLFSSSVSASVNVPFKVGQHAYFTKHVKEGAVCPSFVLMGDFMHEEVGWENRVLNNTLVSTNMTNVQFLNTLPRIFMHNKKMVHGITQDSRDDDCTLIYRHKKLLHTSFVILGKPKNMQLRTYYNYKKQVMMKGPNSFWHVKLLGPKWTGDYWLPATNISRTPVK